MNFWIGFLYDAFLLIVVPSVLLMYCYFLGNKYEKKYKDKIIGLSKKEKDKYTALTYVIGLIAIIVEIGGLALISSILTDQNLRLIANNLWFFGPLLIALPLIVKYGVLSGNITKKSKSNNIEEN